MRSNYYQAGDNYGRAGNYAYQAGGIFSKIGGALKGAIGGFITGGPLGALGGGIKGALGGKALALPPPPQGLPIVRTPGVRGFVQRALPGGATGYEVGTVPGYRRPRMNPMNVKALRRASRRLDSFAKTARKALRHSPFMLVSRASRAGRGRSPGVITRSEAARALKR